MICPNCGGEFADWALKCPYCGGVNDKGAEAEYMKHMEELRKRLDNLDEESEASYSKSMSRTVKRLLIVIGILLAAAVVIILAFFIVRKNVTSTVNQILQLEKSNCKRARTFILPKRPGKKRNTKNSMPCMTKVTMPE